MRLVRTSVITQFVLRTQLLILVGELLIWLQRRSDILKHYISIPMSLLRFYIRFYIFIPNPLINITQAVEYEN